jgi:CubicO group peptidase (beta-lactamase class C family)
VSEDLPRSAAAAQQVDPAAVLAFVDAIEADPAIELHSLMVVRHGHVVAEGWWAPHTPERTRLLYSLSKSFTSTALGLALEEGRFGLDDTVVSHFPRVRRGDHRSPQPVGHGAPGGLDGQRPRPRPAGRGPGA